MSPVSWLNLLWNAMFIHFPCRPVALFRSHAFGLCNVLATSFVARMVRSIWSGSRRGNRLCLGIVPLSLFPPKLRPTWLLPLNLWLFKQSLWFNTHLEGCNRRWKCISRTHWKPFINHMKSHFKTFPSVDPWPQPKDFRPQKRSTCLDVLPENRQALCEYGLPQLTELVSAQSVETFRGSFCTQKKSHQGVSHNTGGYIRFPATVKLQSVRVYLEKGWTWTNIPAQFLNLSTKDSAFAFIYSSPSPRMCTKKHNKLTRLL